MFIKTIYFRGKRAYKEIIVKHYKDLSIRGPH